jgi:hypothetical protein
VQFFDQDAPLSFPDGDPDGPPGWDIMLNGSSASAGRVGIPSGSQADHDANLVAHV